LQDRARRPRLYWDDRGVVSFVRKQESRRGDGGWIPACAGIVHAPIASGHHEG
jgi:hypothetical protein